MSYYQLLYLISYLRLFVSFILQPVGVVGAIAPWNFPLAMITRKVCLI